MTEDTGAIVIFRLPPKLTSTRLSSFCKKFFGQETSSWKGRYRYRRKGFLDDVPHRKFQRGVIIIYTKDVQKTRAFLAEHGADIHVRKVELISDDIQILSGKR